VFSLTLDLLIGWFRQTRPHERTALGLNRQDTREP
jgi:hypothetical protein